MRASKAAVSAGRSLRVPETPASSKTATKSQAGVLDLVCGRDPREFCCLHWSFPKVLAQA